MVAQDPIPRRGNPSRLTLTEGSDRMVGMRNRRQRRSRWLKSFRTRPPTSGVKSAPVAWVPPMRQAAGAPATGGQQPPQAGGGTRLLPRPVSAAAYTHAPLLAMTRLPLVLWRPLSCGDGGCTLGRAIVPSWPAQAGIYGLEFLACRHSLNGQLSLPQRKVRPGADYLRGQPAAPRDIRLLHSQIQPRCTIPLEP